MRNPLWALLAAALPVVAAAAPMSHPCAPQNKSIDWTAGNAPKAFSWFEAQYGKYQNKLSNLPGVDVASPDSLNQACAQMEGDELQACGAVVDWELLQKSHIKNDGNPQTPRWVSGFSIEGASAELQDGAAKRAMKAICDSYDKRAASAAASKKKRDADAAEVAVRLEQRRVEDAKLQASLGRVASSQQSDVPTAASANVSTVKPAAAKPAVCGGCGECGKGTFAGNVACTKAMQEPLCNSCN